MPPELSRRLSGLASEPLDPLLSRLGTTRDGLEPAQAARIRRRLGANDVHRERAQPAWLHLWHCYRNPFSVLLTVLAVLSWWTGEARSSVVIAAIVALATALRFVQETRSHRAADAMKSMVTNTATVVRPTGVFERPIRELVPGDLVKLSAGDMVPADMRVIEAKDLFVSQSAMTGEALPVEKSGPLPSRPGASPVELDNLVFMGTNVVSGSATALVLNTGARTYFGALAAELAESGEPLTAFQVGVNRVSWLLIRFMLVMVPAVLLINGIGKGDWLQALLFALSIAVGLTPEMLPMIVTSTLAKGAVALSRQKVIVKRLDAIQNFGAMDLLCTDKTGTLTQDRVVLKMHLSSDGAENDEVLDYAFLNSHYQTGLKNLLDVAVLEHVDRHRSLDIVNAWRKIDEIPFDFTRRRMSVVAAHRDGVPLLVCKGALDEVLAVCTAVRSEGRTVPLDREALERARHVAARLNEDGLRVVAVALRRFEGATQTRYGVADEAGLTLVGFIAFLDPPKESTAQALRMLSAQGIAVKILTGDNDRVAAKVMRDVGLAVSGPLLGDEVERLDDAALGERAEQCSLLARLTPAHKERVVRVLRERGHVVGFLGDGINDAPALHAADIGISVDTAVDIAKESADVVLREKSLTVLAAGVEQGRRTFANMLKYVRMTASSNFGNVFSVLFASIALPFLPMLPVQLLLQNLLYDVSQTGIPFDEVDAAELARPLRWHADEVGRFMLWFGPVSSIFDLATFGVMWFVFDARTPDRAPLFHAGWFIEGLCSQVLVTHLLRTRRIPFVQSTPGAAVLVTTTLVVAAAILLVQSTAGLVFGLPPLPLAYFGWLLAILLGYALLAQAVKSAYAARHGWH